MTAMGPDRRPVRRAATSRELHSGRPKSEWPEVDAVLEAFARGRLLVLDTDRAEIAHDVLLQAWPRLRGWLEEDETSMILYGQLAEDTARWRSSEGDRALLYRGVQLTATLQAARVWDADPGRYPALSTSEADFLRASGRALARGRWRRRALAGLLAVLVIAALVGAGIAVKNARTSAARQSTTNASQRLAAQSTALDAADPVTAALLAGAAWRLAPTAQARYSLLQSLAQPARGVLTASSGVVTALAYSPDGTTLAAGYSGGAIRLWDLASHRADQRHQLGRHAAGPGVHRRRQAARSRGRRRGRHLEPDRSGPDHRASVRQPGAYKRGRVQPGRPDRRHRRRRRERPAVGRGHRAGDRPADELGRQAGGGGGV